MLSVVSSVITGIVVGLASWVFAPRMQHYFWRRQRHAEVCLHLVEECTAHTAKFYERLPNTLRSNQLTDEDRADFLKWHYLSVQVQALFSDATFAEFNRMEKLATDLLGHYPTEESRSLFSNREEFFASEKDAFKALYDEMGMTAGKLLIPWWKFWKV